MFWYIFLIIVSAPPTSTLFPYTTLFRSRLQDAHVGRGRALGQVLGDDDRAGRRDAARAERLERPRREVRRVRRVEEDDPESGTVRGEPPEGATGVEAEHPRLRLDAERPDVRVERGDGARLALDEGRVQGAP